MAELSHTDSGGKARMVDVSQKTPSHRRAKASGFIFLQDETLELIRKNEIAKGSVLDVSRLAGIQAAKKTAELIMLAHPLALTHIEVKTHMQSSGISIEAIAKTRAETGVEMEALTAVNIALLNIYDMCKAVDNSMKLSDITLIEKHKSA